MKFEKPLTYLITRGELTPENFEQKKHRVLETLSVAARSGVSMIQIREKAITTEQLLELSKDCVAAVGGRETKILINSRPDVAVAADAHGVQLPEEGIPVSEVRRSFPAPFLIGASVHGLDAARSAKSDGADFVVFGPVFDSGEKKGKGVGELKVISRDLREFPLIAVGGIDESNKDLVLQNGATGFAAIRYLNRLILER